MGLDIYFFEKEKELAPDGETVRAEFAYWRKHNRLMTAMAQIVGEQIENCKNYPLTVEMLDELIYRANDPEICLAETGQGFFWGGEYEYDDAMREEDVETFEMAKKAIEGGAELSFRAWW